MFTIIGFMLDPGSSLVDMQQIPVVVGDVKCGCDYIVIIMWLAENVHISMM